mmetsp:Transcript_49160/g.106469  ORF Transcript_49160/g.106469 Transcript_49160/m.106469 type:complete len:285 (+) Transcript_49160:370-1224(+)
MPAYHSRYLPLVQSLRIPSPSSLLLRRRGDVEHEVNDVAILHDICFAFLTVLASSLDFGHGCRGADRLEVVKGDDLRLDEATLKVRVDYARGLRRQPAVVHCPAANLFLARREKVDQVELLVAGDDHLRQRRLAAALAHVLGELGFVVAQRPRLLLPFNREGDHRAAAMLVNPLANPGKPFVLLPRIVRCRHVDKVHDWLGREQRRQLLANHGHLFCVPVMVTDRLARLQQLTHFCEAKKKVLGKLEFAALQTLLLNLLLRIDICEILPTELVLDRLKVTHSIH